MTQIFVKEEASISLPFPELSDDQFFEFCANNPEYRIERTAEGRIVIMSGTGGKTGNRNIELSMPLQTWAKKDRRGIAFDSSTLFLLPNRAMRSPDAAWVLRSRLAGLTDRDKERYLPLCPDFCGTHVAERSATRGSREDGGVDRQRLRARLDPESTGS